MISGMTDKQLVDAFIAHNNRLAGKGDQLEAARSAIWLAISEQLVGKVNTIVAAFAGKGLRPGLADGQRESFIEMAISDLSEASLARATLEI